MSELQMQDNLFWLLMRVSMRAKHGVMKLAEEYDLTIMQAFTLCLLEQNKAIPMNSVSTILQCDASNITGIVDRLVSIGYITRKESPVDRRVKTIELTKAGHKARTAVMQKSAMAELPSLAGLSPEEQETLKSLLTKALASCPGAN